MLYNYYIYKPSMWVKKFGSFGRKLVNFALCNNNINSNNVYFINMVIKKFRPIHTPVHFARLFEREGLNRGFTKKARIESKLNLSELHDASIFLFKHVIEPSDVRWSLAKKYAELKKELGFSTFDLENGLRSVYSSRTQGQNKAYGASFVGQIHILQLARSLRNFELGTENVSHRFSQRIGSNYELKFAQTDSIQKEHNRFGVSGCPEAMWQLQLWSPKGYVGRVGFNFHTEGKNTVITIANIQGAVGKKEEQNAFEIKMGKPFGEVLVERLQHTLGPKFEYRGAIPTEKNQSQYRMTFRKAKPVRIKVWDNKVKTVVEDRRTIKLKE